jgi:thymidine kinase
MMAGKTLSLIRAYESADPRTRLAIKPSIDTRYSSAWIVSHNGIGIPAESLDNLQNVESLVGDRTAIFIDEGQFFMDLSERCASLLRAGKSVWVSGLNATAQQRPWASMSEILAMADDIVHLKVDRCQMCHKFPGSHTVTRASRLDPTMSTMTIKIGGGDEYLAVCRGCLDKRP